MKKQIKGALALEYVFIIFLSLIAVFVIIGLLTSWSFSANKMVCKLSGTCQDERRVDSQSVSLDCTEDEIIKYSKLCYSMVNEGKIKQGEICYVITCQKTFELTKDIADNINDALLSFGSQNNKIIIQESSKFVIQYDYGSSTLVIS